MNTPIIIAGIAAPDTELTRQANALAEGVHNKAMLHHVHRTWWFSEFLGKRRGLKYDRELLYLASVLHDLGLTEQFGGEHRFEVDGAYAASNFLVAHGYSEQKAEMVWDAIALHSSTGIAELKAPEIALLSMGAHVDIFGLRLEEISPELIDETLGLYPRIGMKAAFTEAVANVVRKKPHLALGTGLVDVGRRHVHGFDCPNVCDLIDHAPFDS
ncbi:HD domain-containing protein [Pseudoduganella sp. UC29_106]|uniref:HD domain-containing protein n=1 Tax=Pseudoduganella sp. UC29_106 TaxID=3374553 RepID=UPI0037565F97